jgi:hypothetical protein
MLRAGFGQADITPQPTGKPTGSYRPRVMIGAHDPLLAAACVIDDGTSPVALVGIDAGVIVRWTADAAREMIAQRTAIAPANVVISASHTHQGGASLSTFHAQADPHYAGTVARAVADAVTQAYRARGEAHIGSGFGRVSGIHFNRRFLMRDGREVTHPGKLHPDIVRPAGPVDDKVGVLAIRDAAQKKLLGVVVNFGCHCTVTEDGNEYSADYVHYLREHLRRLLGAVQVVFLLGACGDVTQIDNQSTNIEKGHPHAEGMGRTLAQEVARAVGQIAWSAPADAPAEGAGASASAARVLAIESSVPIPIREQDYREPPTLGLGAGDFWAPIYAREKEHVAEMRAATPVVDCRVTAIRIGDFALVANGGELFAQPALDIQQASPIARTWVVTLANEYLGYVPTANAHYAGGYEVRLARSSYLAADAAQKLTEASLAALRRLAAQD